MNGLSGRRPPRRDECTAKQERTPADSNSAEMKKATYEEHVTIITLQIFRTAAAVKSPSGSRGRLGLPTPRGAARSGALLSSPSPADRAAVRFPAASLMCAATRFFLRPRLDPLLFAIASKYRYSLTSSDLL